MDAGISQGLFPIRTVSKLTGVNSITLRAWEKRHGLIEPVRKDSGHRLYTQQHIDSITRIVNLLDRGMRIGQVRDFIDSERASASDDDSDQDSTVRSSTDQWTRYRDHMVTAVINFQEAELDGTYHQALSLYPIEVVTQKLITPLLTELGRRWETDTGSIAEEHFFAFYLRNKLGARFHHRSISLNGPTLLMACLPKDRHEIGLLLCALSCNEAGYKTIVLGSDMPLAELPSASDKTSSQAIVLSGLLELSGRMLKEDLPELVSKSSVPIFLGGRASLVHCDALRKMGIEPLGTDPDAGLNRLINFVPL